MPKIISITKDELLSAFEKSNGTYKDVSRIIGLSRRWVQLKLKAIGIKSKHNPQRRHVVCKNCGLPFTTFQHHEGKFCSMRCVRESRMGSKQYNAAFTENDILEIRNSSKSVKEIAREYGVHLSTVYAVLSGRTYRNQ